MKRSTNGKIFSLLKRCAILTLSIVIVFLCVAASISSVNTFVIHENEEWMVYNSRTQSTSEALLELGIIIGEDRYVEMPETVEQGVAEIYIFNKKKVNIKVGNETSLYYSHKENTVNDILLANNLTLGEFDLIFPSIDSEVTDGMQIEITRISYSTEEKTTVIPFKKEKRPSADMTKGTNKVTQEGVNGSKKTTYKIKYVNGNEVERVVTNETITKEPVTQITEYGTKPIDTSGFVVTKNGQKLKYKKKLTMTATAYTTERSSDKITATGRVAKVGLVAVDPRVIPLGSRLYITSTNGKSWVYGTAVAADTGVRGNKIDLFFNTYSECISFGRRKAIVYILE